MNAKAASGAEALAEVGTIAILGVGLIGGSLGLALKAAGFAGRIIGFNRRESEADLARARGAVDASATSMQAAVETADLVILCMGPGVMPSVMAQIAPVCPGHAVISDVGSVKAGIVKAGEALFGGRFVGAHPIAGREQHGIEAALPALFADRSCVLTPSQGTEQRALRIVRALWQAVGSEVHEMDAGLHDQMLALTSHLPHLLAYVLLDLVAGHPQQQQIAALLGGGFRDFSRIASSDPVLWADISLQNRQALLEILADYRQQLDSLATALAIEDGEALQKRFSRGKMARDALFGPHPEGLKQND
ncbi:prephenate dehydrogenase [Thermithiobacillus plumbiphilus]|uniref:Prephenate dehydrogenase/arogenate dehydrogenase family protein n=1 Tax=Thermithiobacillus plumbiphilus TaxID=1729899 RepID=A0ABU9D450_9PROT